MPSGRTACDTCGARVYPRHEQSPLVSIQVGGEAQPSAVAVAEPVHLCPRCGFRGHGTSYFSRGLHVAALVGLTLMTGFMMGLGGLAYFLMRHNHRVCPRCGLAWGRHGMSVPAALPATGGRVTTPDPVPSAAGEGIRQGWAIFLFILAAIFALIGIGEGTGMLLVMAGMTAAGGYFAFQGARSAREQRRNALITSLQLPVLQLAGRRKGVLTVTQVAAELGWTLPRAEKVLNSLDDGLRVSSDVTDEGVIVYYFRELMHPPATPPLLAEAPPRDSAQSQLN
ncbi:MAG TPA: hypothetical protein VFX98_01545 [Longimicrobiaceae bacterium]|nr:hypothetical protein [Longimicrobiaceae bacterium]